VHCEFAGHVRVGHETEPEPHHSNICWVVPPVDVIPDPVDPPFDGGVSGEPPPPELPQSHRLATRAQTAPVTKILRNRRGIASLEQVLMVLL